MESTQPSSAEKKQARRRRIRRPLSSQPTAPVSSGGAENATENKSGEKPLPTLKVRPPRELDPREPIVRPSQTSGEPVSTPKLDASKQRFSTLGKSGGLVVAPPCVDCRAAPRTVTYLCCKSLLRCVACHVRAESTSCVRCGLDYHYMGGFISARYF